MLTNLTQSRRTDLLRSLLDCNHVLCQTKQLDALIRRDFQLLGYWWLSCVFLGFSCKEWWIRVSFGQYLTCLPGKKYGKILSGKIKVQALDVENMGSPRSSYDGSGNKLCPGTQEDKGSSTCCETAPCSFKKAPMETRDTLTSSFLEAILGGCRG